MMMRVDSKYHARDVLGKFYKMLKEEWNDFPAIIELKKMEDKRSLCQNSLAEVWYKVICNDVISKGYHFTDPDTGEKIPFTPEDIKYQMKKQILGSQRLEYNGEIIEKVPETSKLSKGAMVDYMNKLYHRCLDIGLILPIPEDSEYQKLLDKQNG
jgi:hypothetical protein